MLTLRRAVEYFVSYGWPRKGVMAIILRKDGQYVCALYESGSVIEDLSFDDAEQSIRDLMGDKGMLVLDEHQPLAFALHLGEQIRRIWSPLWASPPQLHLELPPLSDIVPRHACPSWLLDGAQQLAASPYALDRLCALGLLGRLWSPTKPEGVATQLGDMLAGKAQSIYSRARSWASGIAQQAWDELARLAVHEADAWATRFEAVCEALTVDDPQAGELLHQLLLRRDDLECIAWSLHLSGAAQPLRNALEALDRAGRAQLSALSSISIEAGRRLETAAWCEPGAWWSTLAVA